MKKQNIIKMNVMRLFSLMSRIIIIFFCDFEIKNVLREISFKIRLQH